MKPLYLGDSYDHVKRVLIETSQADHWVAAAMLTEKASPEELRLYGTFLKVEVPERFAFAPARVERAKFFADLKTCCANSDRNIFLDPCTGVRPTPRFRGSMREHVSTDEIIDLLTSSNTRLLCFDQSLSRGTEDHDRSEKLSLLGKQSVFAFYFKSHASFLCASKSLSTIDAWREAILKAGIPSLRIQSV